MGIALFARFGQGETFRMSRLRPRWARLCLGGPAFGAGRKVHAAAAAKGVCRKSGKRESICRPQGAGMPRLSAAKGRLPCKEVFFRGKVYSSEKVFTASSPDAAGGRRAGGPFCTPRFSRAPVFARRSLFRVLFILRAVRPSLRKGARRLAGEARGFQGRRLPCAGRAAQIVDFFFQTG